MRYYIEYNDIIDSEECWVAGKPNSSLTRISTNGKSWYYDFWRGYWDEIPFELADSKLERITRTEAMKLLLISKLKR